MGNARRHTFRRRDVDVDLLLGLTRVLTLNLFPFMRQFVMHLGDNFAKFLLVTQSGSDRAETAKFCRFPWPLQTGFRNVVFRASSIAFRRRANCRTLSGPCTCLSKPTGDAKMRKTDVLLDTTARAQRTGPIYSLPPT